MSSLLTPRLIVTVLVGDRGKETDLVRVVQTMCDYPSTHDDNPCWGCCFRHADRHRYPPDGPLRHLLVVGDRAALAREVCTLQQALPTHTTLSFVTHEVPFLVLSGEWYSHIPPDIRTWLTDAHLHIK